jgi:hypothetical protein
VARGSLHIKLFWELHPHRVDMLALGFMLDERATPNI